jgi:hypothetical protein
MPRLLLLALLLIPCLGCGSGFKTVPVSGQVTLDGQAVADAGVLFVPVEKGPTARAVTDSQGRYKLKTNELNGAAPGKYQVAVMKESASGVGVGADGLETAPGVKSTVKRQLPATYADPNTSPLEIIIEAERSDANLKLSSKAAASK